MQIILFLLKVLLINFNTHRWILSTTLITAVFQWWFAISLIPSTFINWNSVRTIYPFSSICLLIYISVDLRIFIRFFWVKIQCYHYLFCCINCSAFGRQALFQVGLCALSACPLCWRASFLAPQDAPGSLVFFIATALSPWSPRSMYWRLIIIWALSMLIGYWSVIVTRSCQQ